MKTKLLGNSTLQISTIGFGCMSLSDDHHFNKALLHEAFHAGINFFDTADLYQQGFNEESVGLAFKEIRHKVILASKVGNQIRPDGNGWDWNPTKKYILESVEKSLQRLQTDYIDLYQLHGGTLDDPIDETIEAFELLKQQGKIRFYGISSIRPNVIREYIKRSTICSVMMQYSLLDRRPAEECLALLQQHHIGVLTRGTLASGLLTGKPAKPYLTYSQDEVAQAAKAIEEISGVNRTPTGSAIQFVLHHPAITSAVIGIRNTKQLQEALQASTSAPLSDDEFRKVSKALRANVYEQHR